MRCCLNVQVGLQRLAELVIIFCMSLKTQEKLNVHPCQRCGACCAAFRVSFWRSELSSGGSWQVPLEAVEDSGGSLVSLKGTTQHNPGCDSLKGRVGDQVTCQIYENRPSPCRNFKASYEEGYREERCDLARSKHGLRPLTKQDWKVFRSPSRPVSLE